MKGYMSFVLVFLSSLILLHSMAVLNAAHSTDLSRAVEIERAYGLQMNVKECVLESVRAGALAGFSSYDFSHDIMLCKHCMDHLCVPPTPANPVPENICDGGLCSLCFRESEARLSSVSGAQSGLMALWSGRFDDDYSVLIGPAALDARLEAGALSKNGMRLSNMRFTGDFPIILESSRFGFRGSSQIPEGTVVQLGTDDD